MHLLMHLYEFIRLFMLRMMRHMFTYVKAVGEESVHVRPILPPKKMCAPQNFLKSVLREKIMHNIFYYMDYGYNLSVRNQLVRKRSC